jgi:hypothetical protein
MTDQWEYHISVRHLTSASIRFASLLVMPLVFLSIGWAQINGVPSSVTSPGFGGHPVNGPRSSVTSLGPRGYSGHPGVTFSNPPNVHRGGNEHHRRHRAGDFIPPLYYAVPVPYAVDESAVEEPESNDDSPYEGGPTIFDRRGSGASSYVPPARDVPSSHSTSAADDPAPRAESPQEPTLLVFKDGHKVEVGNYAIVGSTLFDLTPGHPRKVAISDLDLEATRQQNQDRGVMFELPPSLQAN